MFKIAAEFFQRNRNDHLLKSGTEIIPHVYICKICKKTFGSHNNDKLRLQLKSHVKFHKKQKSNKSKQKDNKLSISSDLTSKTKIKSKKLIVIRKHSTTNNRSTNNKAPRNTDNSTIIYKEKLPKLNTDATHKINRDVIAQPSSAKVPPVNTLPKRDEGYIENLVKKMHQR